MLNWTNESINVLGVELGHGSEEVIRMNYAGIIDKISNITKSLRGRGLSLLGKTMAINSLIVYKMNVLPNMPEQYILEINKLLVKFIWNGKRPKIALQALQCDKLQGGVGLVDLENKEKSLKILWVKAYFQEDTIKALADRLLLARLKEKVWETNLRRGNLAIFLRKSF